jgi:hypothetical protein
MALRQALLILKMKQFKPGGKVLLFSSRVHLFGHARLCSMWEGPYLVLHTVDVTI